MQSNIIGPQSFFVEGIPKLPNRTKGQHWSKTYKEKAEWEKIIGWLIRAKGINPVAGKVHIRYTIQVGSQRKVDPDNLTWAVSKICNDALQKMGTIRGDSIEDVELSYAFNRNKPAGFRVELSEICPKKSEQLQERVS